MKTTGLKLDKMFG